MFSKLFSKDAKLTFFGAAQTVTGSKHLLDFGGEKILLDAGLFQGEPPIEKRNWEPLKFDPSKLAAIILSHAHIDHSGFLPHLVRKGFRGPIFCTPGTADLVHIMLPDSAHIQEETWHDSLDEMGEEEAPPLLYDREDAEKTLRLLELKPFGRSFKPSSKFEVTFRSSGHILGSALVEIQMSGGPKLVFTGDIGRYNHALMVDPEPIQSADYILMESTYGDRQHRYDVDTQLAQFIQQAYKRGGPMVVPSFAVGKTQELLWRLTNLEKAGKLPHDMPVYVDSPMATAVTEIYGRHSRDMDMRKEHILENGQPVFERRRFQFVKTAEESKRLNDYHRPMIVISASGMASGGRVLHHLKQHLPDPRATVLLISFQAEGTLGRELEQGAEMVEIHGRQIRVNATVERLNGMSAHADRDEMIRWLKGFKNRPKKIFLVHGEPSIAEVFAKTVQDQLHYTAHIAGNGETVNLD